MFHLLMKSRNLSRKICRNYLITVNNDFFARLLMSMCFFCLSICFESVFIYTPVRIESHKIMYKNNKNLCKKIFFPIFYQYFIYLNEHNRSFFQFIHVMCFDSWLCGLKYPDLYLRAHYATEACFKHGDKPHDFMRSWVQSVRFAQNNKYIFQIVLFLFVLSDQWGGPLRFVYKE